MGDTFQDPWEGLLPKEFGEWKFERQENTKLEGNNYRYEHATVPDWALVLHSKEVNKSRLSCSYLINFSGPEIGDKEIFYYVKTKVVDHNLSPERITADFLKNILSLYAQDFQDEVKKVNQIAPGLHASDF